MSDFPLCMEDEFILTSREIQTILNSTHDALVAVNTYGIINIFNAAAEKILLINAREALGRKASQIIKGSRLEIVMKTGIAELNQQQKIGEISVIANRVPVRDKNGRIMGAVESFRNINKIMRLAKKLTNLEAIQEMLEAIINSSQEVISVVDENERIILVNPAYTRLVGMTKEKVIGKSPMIDIQQGESVHLHVLKTGKPVKGVPMLVGPQGKEVIANAAPIIVNGKLRGSVAVVHDVSEINYLTSELCRMRSLVRQMKNCHTFDDIVGSSPAMKAAVEQAYRAAATPATILLTGESGTGKELFANAIHRASSRSHGPLIKVNCAAIPETLLESELFGYEEGAFTGARKGGKKGLFAEAIQGTIFLDEIGEMASSVQAKLLRVLQEKEIVPVGGVTSIPIDVRVIAATNLNLKHAVANGKFRADLFYRINVFPIVIPPLRERLEDIPSLTEFLLRKLNHEYGRCVRCLDSSALAILSKYNWPGNVRELENYLGRVLINMQSTEDVIRVTHLPALTQSDSAAKPMTQASCEQACSAGQLATLETIVKQAERRAIEAALAVTGGNRIEAAQRLGISVRSLYYKLEKYHQE
ncbi:sigma-54 interaction domain-containing protein [Sporomusa acidovorans]|uniref:Anaerobic nitric oxide reductase transcription regulator NorR n=1 Tax=Sporomusa acidovorans (strain ATCC 49682 / DSM 3132 / Mol) TaxID=1123286 RepID=A0ABZ3IXW1_SPOA4|nr:sigma-54-dependent Fis family transcriptional regulator [Sporomusa acidovorans]OZC16974.1 arginine utilization regulatory protein RocR [Sporomusa acidovorans DSM 3132]SDE14112.1 PAS domain S-box-containing protein [Sporomusa acidovorans]